MKKAVQFGAGNIGRGFIGALLSQSGYHVVFADVVDKIIDKINEDKTYTVHVMDVECEDQKIENISGDIYGRIASMTSNRGILLRLYFVPLICRIFCKI